MLLDLRRVGCLIRLLTWDSIGDDCGAEVSNSSASGCSLAMRR